MSRIGPALDRPIPTSEKTIATEQASETESIQKTGTGEALPDAKPVTKEPASATETKGQQFESHLGGLARQTELQAQLPGSSATVLKDLPEVNRNLDPNIRLNEKIDVMKNLPAGQSIKTGLAGLGLDKGKTGPNHMGVGLTTGGMKAPADVLADLRNPGAPANTTSRPPGQKNGKSVEGGGVKGSNFAEGHGNTPPPGAELNFRAPKMSQVGQATGAEYGTIFGPNNNVPAAKPADPKPGPTKAETDAKKTEPSEETKKKEAEWKKKNEGKMTDPDAGGGGDFVLRGGGTPDDIAKAVQAHFGQVEHTINPDLGAGGGPVAPTSGEIKDPMDLVRDPIEGETKSKIVVTSEKKATLAADIHGPRYVNSDAGVQAPPAGGNRPGTGDPNTGG